MKCKIHHHSLDHDSWNYIFPHFWGKIAILFLSLGVLYSYSIQKRQSISIFFINEKFRWYILFLHLHFTWLCGSWKPKRILKKYLFWKYESWFPSEVTKLTSVCYPQNDAWKKYFNQHYVLDLDSICILMY